MFSFFLVLGIDLHWGLKEKKFYTPFSYLAWKSFAGMAKGPKEQKRRGAGASVVYK